MPSNERIREVPRMRRRRLLTRFFALFMRTPLKAPLLGGYVRMLQLLEVTRRALMPTEIVILEAVMGSYLSQATYVAIRLGIPEALAAGPRTADDLAAATHADADYLARLLRFLASKGLLRRRRDGRYLLTRHGQGLRQDSPASLRGFAEFNGSAANWQAWGALLTAVRTGKAAFTLAHGREFFDFVQGEPELGEVFDRAMIGFSEAMGPLLAAAYRFGHGTIVDVGGGRGALLAGLLPRRPGLTGVLFDLPEVVRDAPDYLRAAGVEARVRIESGTFFAGVPAGHDYYLLKNVLHDWGDPDCLTILGHVARAIKPDGRLLVAEMLVRPRPGYPIASAMDLGMMVLTRGGRERTREQYESLLARSGFVLEQVITCTDFANVLVAVPQRQGK